MSRKRPEELRSHRWLGVSDLRSFGHRSRLRQVGYDTTDWAGRPVIGIINTWSDINPCHTHLRQRAEEKGWSPDWSQYNEHSQAAEALLAQDDVPGAFREYCRAMLPLTRALHDRRQKEEVFQPVWDKTR